MYPLSASVLGQDVRTRGSQAPPPRRVGSRNALFESVSALIFVVAAAPTRTSCYD